MPRHQNELHDEIYISEAESTASLSRVLDEVELEGGSVIVTRENGERFLFQSLPDPDAMDATDYLLSNPANARMLERSIADADAGRLTEHELIDP